MRESGDLANWQPRVGGGFGVRQRKLPLSITDGPRKPHVEMTVPRGGSDSPGLDVIQSGSYRCRTRVPGMFDSLGVEVSHQPDGGEG